MEDNTHMCAVAIAVRTKVSYGYSIQLSNSEVVILKKKNIDRNKN